MKVYQVIFEDEYNNLYHLGFFKQLKDSLKSINQHLELYRDTMLDEDGCECEFQPLTEFDLVPYASTFNDCFDKTIWTKEGCLMIRGFIFEDFEQETNRFTA